MTWTPFNFFKYDPTKHDFDNTTFNIKQALNDNWDHVKTLIEELRNNKVDKVTGKGLSTNDYDNTEKQKVANAAEHVANPGIHVTAAEKNAWNAKGKGNCQMLLFANKSVAIADWADDTTYTGYPKRAAIPCTGVTVEHIAEVTFSAVDAMSGNYAPVCETGNGVVHIYTSAVPAAAITVQVEARKVMA